MGKSKVGEWRMEGCLGCRCQREYLLLLWHPRGIDTHDLQFTLPRVTIYRVVCERLAAIGRIRDAIECFHEMMSKLGGEVHMSGRMTKWISGEFMFYLFVCHKFNLSGQISPADVSPLSRVTVARRRLELPSIQCHLHHF